MWTSIIDLSPRRVILTNLLGRFWRGAYFSSFAPLQVQNVPRQSLPGVQWVRVRNRLAGICGSDLHLIHADGDLRIAPAALPGHTQTYLGHEVVGEVIEIGDGVQQLQVGDRVVLQHGKNCLSSGVEPLCRMCATGNYGLCERGTLPGPDPIGGGWSEEMLLHEQQLFRVPPAMTDAQAVLLEPTSVAVHTVLRHVPQAGERVLIIGAGTIGLLTLQVVRALSPQAEISVLARYPFQVEKATRTGAAHIIYPQDSYSGVQQATQARLFKSMLGNKMLLGGYDVIYDTVGTQRTIHNALRWTSAKGTIVLVGVNLHLMHLDLTPVWYQEVNLIGTMGQGMETWPLGSDERRSTFAVTTDLMIHGILKPEQLITHRFALNNYRQALLTAMDKHEQRTIKVIFDYSLLPASVVPNVRASARQHKPVTQHSSVEVIENEEPLRPAPAMLSTGGATWEKQALPVVPQARPTQDDAELVDAPTLAPVREIDPDATQKVRIIDSGQLEPTQTMPAVERHAPVKNVEHPIPTDDIALQETAQHEVFEQEDATLHALLAQEETQDVPAVDNEAIQATPSIYDAATQDVPIVEGEVVSSINSEETESVPSINNAETEAVPSVYNEATEAIPSMSNEAADAGPSVSDQDTIATPSVSEPQIQVAEGDLAEETPLNELEWLEIIAAEETAPEQAALLTDTQEEQQTQSVEDAPIVVPQEEEDKTQTDTQHAVAQTGYEEQTHPNVEENEVQTHREHPVIQVVRDEPEEQRSTEENEVQFNAESPVAHIAEDEPGHPNTEEHTYYTFVDEPDEDTDSPVLQDLQYEREPLSDFRTDDFADINQDAPVEDYPPDEEQSEAGPLSDSAMNSSARALYKAKTSKAINPGKQRSKNRRGRK